MFFLPYDFLKSFFLCFSFSRTFHGYIKIVLLSPVICFVSQSPTHPNSKLQSTRNSIPPLVPSKTRYSSLPSTVYSLQCFPLPEPPFQAIGYRIHFLLTISVFLIHIHTHTYVGKIVCHCLPLDCRAVSRLFFGLLGSFCAPFTSQ